MGSKAAANPDPYGYLGYQASQQTAANNQQAAQTALEANRADQITPWGSSTWTQTPKFDQAKYDEDVKNSQLLVQGIKDGTDTSALANYYRQTGTLPAQAMVNRDDAKYNTNSWTNTVTLTPQQQAALTSQQNVELQRSQAAEDLIAKMREIYGKDFVAPDRKDYTDSVNPVNQGSLGQAGDFTTGATVNTDVKGALAGVNGVQQDVAGFDSSDGARDKYAQAAYESQMALARPQWAQQDTARSNELALRGLALGSEAEQGAQKAALSTRALQENALLNQSYITGNDSARADYATMLAGVNAKNTAQNQAYTQALGTFTAGNNANQQLFGKDLSTYGAGIDKLKTNAALQQGENTAQAQAYAQALGLYSTDYQAALQERNQPVNEMNALLNGQQIQNPTFNNYAQQQTTTGADASGAYNNWLSGATSSNNANAAASSNNTNAAIGLVGTAAAMFF